MRILRTLTLLGSAATIAIAGDFPHTLPEQFYVQAKRGKSNYSHVLISPDFNPSRGVAWDGKLFWKADGRNSVFERTLKEGLNSMNQQGGYAMKVSVVQCESSFWFTGTMRAEISLQDSDGKIVAEAHEYAIVAKMEERSFREAADKIIADIHVDLGL
jgi:hypothetical protein